MSAAAELRGWLLCSTSSAADERSVICQAVTAPNATTSTASRAPMIRSRPGSVVARARNWTTPPAKGVRRGGWGTPGTGPLPPCDGIAGRPEAAPDAPEAPEPPGEPGVGGAALLVDVTVTSPMVIRHRQYRPW